MYCPKCGAENPNGAGLCHSCGCDLANTSPIDAKTSRLAITALVLMILGILTCGLTSLLPIIDLELMIPNMLTCGLISLPAIIFGIIALVQICKSDGRLKGKEFAISAIIVPLVMIALLIPVLAQASHLAKRLVCGSNVYGFGTAMYVYAYDNDDELPTGSKWCDLLIQEVDVRPQSFVCPGAEGDSKCHYAMNENAKRLGEDPPADMVLLFETSTPGWNIVGGKELLSTDNHRGEGCNILFMDGHARFIKTVALDTLNWGDDEDDQ